MAFLVLLLILALPLVEITGFVVVGQHIGVLATLFLTVASAAVGLSVMRLQGWRIAERARAAFDRDEPPVAEAVEGLAVAVGGVLLLIPGFVTDILGALLLIPPVRRLVIAAVLRQAARHGRFRAWRGPDGTIVEGEFEDVTPARDRDRHRRDALGDGSGRHRG